MHAGLPSPVCSLNQIAARLEIPIESVSSKGALVTPSEPKAPPPLGEPWTCVTATRPNKFDRRLLFEVSKPPLRD